MAVYESLFAAGGDLGLRDAGYYTLDALRVEAGRRAFGAELGPDETAFEAGLAYAVKMDKAADFIGKPALQKQLAGGVNKRLLMFTLDDAQAYAWGGEGILRDGEPVGEITSAGFSHRLGRVVAMGFVRGECLAADGSDDARLLQGRYEVDIAGDRVALRAHLKPLV